MLSCRLAASDEEEDEEEDEALGRGKVRLAAVHQSRPASCSWRGNCWHGTGRQLVQAQLRCDQFWRVNLRGLLWHGDKRVHLA